MFVSLITDCNDDNALNRQATRYAAYLNAPVSTVGVHFFANQGNGELEAAGNIIDALDASQGAKGVVFANCAPRHGKAKKWANGTPFGYFYYKKTLVIATVDGYTLSLVKKCKLVDSINLLDVPTVIDVMIKKGNYESMFRRLVIDSQFRSYEFVPRVAKWLTEGVKLPFETYPITNIPDSPKAIWWIDNFGNTVTTLLPEDIDFQPGKVMKTKFGQITLYERLKDVPDGKPGLIIGSWGIENKRLVSLVLQGKSAAKTFSLKSGDTLW